MRGETRSTEGETARVESLLRAASSFEPERSAPEGLALRALAGLQPDRACRRLSPRLALAAGAAVTLALLGMGVRAVRQNETAPPIVRNLPSPPMGSMPPAAPLMQLASGPSQRKPSAAPPPASRHAPPPEERSPKRARRVARKRAVPAGPPAARRVEPSVPRVRWRERTIRRYASGLVTPAWVAEEAPDGDVVMRPVLLDVPARRNESVQPDAAPNDAGYMLVSSIEE